MRDLEIKESVEKGPGTTAALAAAGPAPGLAPIGAIAVGVVFFSEGGQQPPLFDPHEAFVELGVLFKILRRLFRFVVIFGIIQHGGAHTDLPLLAHEDLVIDTAFAAGPESVILGKLGVSDRLVAQFGIDLHDGQPGGEAEDLGFGIGLAAQFEDLFLDHLSQAAFPEGGGYDQPGIGDVFSMAPGLDIAEAGPDPVIRESDHGLPVAHFFLDIIRASFGDAGTPGFCGGFHFVADDAGEILVGFIGY